MIDQRRDFRSRSVASAFLTSDCEIPNFRAIAEGLTPALNAARTAFSLPFVSECPASSSVVLSTPKASAIDRGARPQW